VCQVYYAPRECFQRDERCRRPIQHRFSFHFESSFRLRSSATLSHCSILHNRRAHGLAIPLQLLINAVTGN
jgi:hypothetical protein